MLICKGCQQAISGGYTTALGHHWHPACFRCHYCRKTISHSQFVTFAGQPYHPHCLKCPGCQRAITSRYVNGDGLPWHADCYKKQHHPKCSVCRKPLTQRYFVDFWGNAYCHTHQGYSNCASCGRIVCEQLTGGGMQYPDGVVICNLCGLHGVTTQEQAEQLMQAMRTALASVGLKLNQAQTPIKLCGRDELHASSRHDFHDERPILGLTRWTITSSGGRVVARNFKDILIQKNLPEEHFRTVAIHELTHAWFFYQHYYHLPIAVEEGLCVLMEYIWLKNQTTKDAEYRRLIIEQSPDPVYGDGFRNARTALQRLPLKMLLQYVKEKKKFPGRLAAFLYH